MFRAEMKFINYELSKHGSCWHKSVEDINKTPLYIRKILEKAPENLSRKQRLNLYLEITMGWSKNNDIYSILKKGGLTPSDRDQIDPHTIVAVMDRHFQLEGAIFPVCEGKRNYKLFTEIRFCLDKNYNLIFCGKDVAYNHAQSCRRGLHYPEFPRIS